MTTKVGVTGFQGFIGKTLCRKLRPSDKYMLFTFGHPNDDFYNREKLAQFVQRDLDVIVHLAGVQKPASDYRMIQENIDLGIVTGKQHI